MCMKFWGWIGRKLCTIQSLVANTMLPIYEIAIVAFQLLCQIGLLSVSIRLIIIQHYYCIR